MASVAAQGQEGPPDLPLNEEDALLALAERFSLPLPVVRDAKSCFDVYRVLGKGPAAGNSENGSCAESLAPPPDAESPPVLSLTGLELFLRDIGCPKTLAEVRDIVAGLVTAPEELIRLHTQEDETYQAACAEGKFAAGREGGGGVDAAAREDAVNRSLVPPPATPAAHLPADSTRTVAEGLTLPQFVYLLQYPDLGPASSGGDRRSGQRTEAEAVFRELDVDGDGALSTADVRAVLAQLLLHEDAADGGGASALATDEGLLKLAAMHSAELRAALDECDVNADGVVTQDDFVSLMRS